MGATKLGLDRELGVGNTGQVCEDCGERCGITIRLGRLWCRECLRDFTEDYNQYLEGDRNGPVRQ